MSQRQPLAIVGYAYRAPDVGRKGLWEFLEQGKLAWSPVPSNRFNLDAYYHPNAEKAGFISSKGGTFCQTIRALSIHLSSRSAPRKQSSWILSSGAYLNVPSRLQRALVFHFRISWAPTREFLHPVPIQTNYDRKGFDELIQVRRFWIFAIHVRQPLVSFLWSHWTKRCCRRGLLFQYLRPASRVSKYSDWRLFYGLCRRLEATHRPVWVDRA